MDSQWIGVQILCALREIPAALYLASMEIVPSLDQTHTPATVKELVTKENDVSEEFYPYLHYHY
jgi:hypothetical protein